MTTKLKEIFVQKMPIYELGERCKTSGYSITIPKVWIVDNKLSIGDYVNIYRDEKNRLILATDKKEKEK